MSAWSIPCLMIQILRWWYWSLIMPEQAAVQLLNLLRWAISWSANDLFEMSQFLLLKIMIIFFLLRCLHIRLVSSRFLQDYGCPCYFMLDKFLWLYASIYVVPDPLSLATQPFFLWRHMIRVRCVSPILIN